MENNENEVQNNPDSGNENGYTGTDSYGNANENGFSGADPFGNVNGNGYTQAPNNNYTMNGQPMGSPYGQPPQPEQKESQALAIAGMVLGIISLVCCCSGYIALVIGIVGFILSLIVLLQKKPGKGMAIAGIICSAIAVIMIVVLTAIGNSVDTNELQKMLEELQEVQ